MTEIHPAGPVSAIHRSGHVQGRFARWSGIGRRPVPTLLLLGLVSILTVLPAIVSDHVLGGDARAHLLWQAHFADTFWQGTIYPRWLPGLNDGFGSPVFFIYPPLAQWLTAIWEPLFPGALNSMVRLVLALALLSTAGAMGCWLWLRRLELGTGAALIGAGVEIFFPYRYYVDTFHRGAIGELAGIAIMPWLLYFATRLRDGDRRAWSGLALSVGLTLLAHLPSALIGVLFAGCYILFLAPRRRWLSFLLLSGSATLCGVAIGAASAIPALSLFQYLANTANLIGAHQQPTKWLLLSADPWINDGIWAAAMAVTLLSVTMTVVLSVIARFDPDRSRRSLIYFLAASVAVVVFLNLEPSRIFWAAQTPLSRIQFPFRLFGIAVFAVAGLAALAWQALAARASERSIALPAAAILLLGGLVLVNAGMFAAHTYTVRDRLPPSMDRILAESAEMSEYVLSDLTPLKARFGNQSALVLSGQAAISRATMASRHADLVVDTSAGSTVALRQFIFSGWQCRIDAGEWFAASPDPALPHVPSCAVPAGRHDVAFRLPATTGERISYILSLAGCLVIIVVWLLTLRRTER